MYITFEEYLELYDECTDSCNAMDERIFNRLAFDVCRLMDIHTTGIDNVKKLQRYFPRDEYNARAVKHCAAKMVNFLDQIREAETSAAMARGYTETDQGLQRRIISRVESGNESISYSETKSTNTDVDAAVADKNVRNTILADIIWECLSGVEDSNGVSLLYMGKYPRGYVC
jgi:hypothetical protein